MVLVVIAFLFGIVTIIPSNLAYAVSSEKIHLTQQYEQFPGQKITGFCYLEWDDEQNLQWRIKVNGLVPETLGHFDLGHWAGEVDVPYTADADGNADSKTQMVLEDNIPYSLFSQFAKCQVLISGYNHLTSPVIALGVSGSSNVGEDENKNLIPSEKKSPGKNFLGLEFGVSNSNIAGTEESNKITSTKKNSFLFYSLEYVAKILKNNTMDAFTGFNSVFGPPSPENISSNTITVSTNVNEDAKEMSTLESLNKVGINSKDTNRSIVAIEKGKGTSDKGTSDKGTSDKGTKSRSNLFDWYVKWRLYELSIGLPIKQSNCCHRLSNWFHDTRDILRL
jgi:hypothetical protein